MMFDMISDGARAQTQQIHESNASYRRVVVDVIVVVIVVVSVVLAQTRTRAHTQTRTRTHTHANVRMARDLSTAGTRLVAVKRQRYALCV